MTVAPDALKTKFPMTARARGTFAAIEARLGLLHPPLAIRPHIAQRTKPGEVEFSSLESGESTLDGIDFVAVDAARLASTLDDARDSHGRKALASMKEDPDHWALKASFGVTPGMGWREIWRPAPLPPPTILPPSERPSMTMRSARWGSAKTRVNFSALHCAVDRKTDRCNIHIDESGFVLELHGGGVALTASMWDHIANELVLKTIFRDWLTGGKPVAGKPVGKVAYVIGETIRRFSIVFPNASNGFAGLEKRVNNLRKPRDPLDAVLVGGKLLGPVGATFDVYESDHFKVQVAGTMVDGDRSITINTSGTW